MASQLPKVGPEAGRGQAPVERSESKRQKPPLSPRSALNAFAAWVGRKSMIPRVSVVKDDEKGEIDLHKLFATDAGAGAKSLPNRPIPKGIEGPSGKPAASVSARIGEPSPDDPSPLRRSLSKKSRIGEPSPSDPSPLQELEPNDAPLAAGDGAVREREGEDPNYGGESPVVKGGEEPEQPEEAQIVVDDITLKIGAVLRSLPRDKVRAATQALLNCVHETPDDPEIIDKMQLYGLMNGENQFIEAENIQAVAITQLGQHVKVSPKRQ